MAKKELGRVIAGVKIYTLPEVAELLQCNKMTARTYVRTGRLPANKVGKNYLITEDSLREFITGTHLVKKPDKK